MNNYSKGSEWRRWDLHVHTASSYDAKYKGSDADELLVNALRENKIKAVAITDHSMIDYKRISHLRELAPDIVFFPGVELRTDKGSNNLHVILIFSEKKDLKTLSENFEVIMNRQKAKAKQDEQKKYWSYEDIVEFKDEQEGLISIHAGRKENGIDQEIKSKIPVKDAIKEDIADSVSFFEIGQLRDVDDYERYVFKDVERKPLIMCSDCHNPKDYNPKEKLWIKADLTFEGLKQCILQPKERVFIGDCPPVLDRCNKNKQVYMCAISVRQVGIPKIGSKKWFDFELPLNPGMVAVIGNKGTGKSAFSDIMGHVCKSRNMKDASFLNPNRFWKAPNYSKDYNGMITWADGVSKTCTLDKYDYETSIEDAQYLPQNYIEELCNNLGEAFQDEINRVIFSYVESTDSGNAKSLEELIAIKCAPIFANIDLLKDELHHINEVIVGFEKRQTSQYIQSINSDYKRKQEELVRHDKSMPAIVKKPEGGDKEKRKELDLIENELRNLHGKKQTIKDRITLLVEQNNDIEELLTKIEQLEKTCVTLNGEISTFSIKYHLNTLDYLIQLSTPREALFILNDTIKNERDKELAKITDPEFGLDAQIDKLDKKKKTLVSNADNEEKAYQAYKDALEEWEKTRRRIIGSANDIGSLEFYKAEKGFIESGALREKYNEAIRRRKDIVSKLYNEKLSLVKTYEEIYNPVEKQIDELLKDLESNVTFKPAVVISSIGELRENILQHVNQKYQGQFKGTEESQKVFNHFVQDTDLSDPESVWRFANNIAHATVEDLDKAEAKVTNIVGYYDKAFDLSYIDVKYRLKLNDRDLEELSPGERGIVLLIFYLALSKDNKPIIIDQPEDNLDNQSVYSKLVPCICKAKERRQVIIVTHNPNIAVACDAEQIIYCKMDKQSCAITYESGAIENPIIKKHVVDVLEGTMPAFELRQKKYN